MKRKYRRTVKLKAKRRRRTKTVRLKRLQSRLSTNKTDNLLALAQTATSKLTLEPLSYANKKTLTVLRKRSIDKNQMYFVTVPLSSEQWPVKIHKGQTIFIVFDDLKKIVGFRVTIKDPLVTFQDIVSAIYSNIPQTLSRTDFSIGANLTVKILEPNYIVFLVKSR